MGGIQVRTWILQSASGCASKRYRELGGEIVTVGADAHRPEHVAYDFERAGEILRSCGFRYLLAGIYEEPENLDFQDKISQ